MKASSTVSATPSAELVRLSVVVPAAQAELTLAAACAALGTGCRERALPDGRTCLEFWVAPGGADGALARLRAVLAPLARAEFGRADEDAGWRTAMREFHQPVEVAGRIRVRPPWHAPSGEAVDVVIDPAMAFGTGQHDTTRGCLELLIAVAPGPLVDIGCGSGVLGIAAAKLGFAPIWAWDRDPLAVDATIANARANGVALAVGLRDVLKAAPAGGRGGTGKPHRHDPDRTGAAPGRVRPSCGNPQRDAPGRARGGLPSLGADRPGARRPARRARLGKRAPDPPVSHTFRYLIAHEPVAGEHVVLPSDDAHHLTRVVRRRVGDAVEIIAPSGDSWPAVLIAAGDAAVLELGAAPRRAARRAPVWLCLGLCEAGRLDTAVEKCTELGVAGIAVFAGARSQRVPAAAAWARRRERLGRVAQAAARQSGQGSLPEIDGLWTIDQVCAALAGRHAIVLDPDAPISLSQALAGPAADAPIALVVGPDAGFAAPELARLRAAGAEVCHLGDTTLRTETAAIVAAGITLALTGHLDRGHAAASTHGETNG